MRTKTSKENLCDKCKLTIPDCGASDIKFGDGEGDDNVIECYSFKTRIEDIFFRSSKVGLLAGGLIRHGLTEKQREEMEMLERLKVTPEGITDGQQKDLDTWNKKIDDGGQLVPTQMEKRDEYKSRLKRPKGLTEKQAEKLQELKERNAKPPELSQGAKTYIKEVWLENEKGFREEVTAKTLRKGLQAEEDAINLISYVDNVMYIKNDKRIQKGHLRGECDVVTEFKNIPTEEEEKTIDAKIIDDTKCSWNPKTFMSMEMSTVEEWQGRSYLYLYDADIFRLRRCLVDCPPDILMEEYKRYCFQHNIIDDSIEKYKPLIDQFYANFLYEDSGNYTQKERVKTFTFSRDYELEEVLLKSIELGVEYYQTITLNMIE